MLLTNRIFDLSGAGFAFFNSDSTPVGRTQNFSFVNNRHSTFHRILMTRILRVNFIHVHQIGGALYVYLRLNTVGAPYVHLFWSLPGWNQGYKACYSDLRGNFQSISSSPGPPSPSHGYLTQTLFPLFLSIRWHQFLFLDERTMWSKVSCPRKQNGDRGQD